MNSDAIVKVLEEAVASGAVAGVAAAVTTATETIFQHCAGTTIAGGGTAITPDTLFWIASMTKPLTSLAALQLVEQGKLSLDAPIGDVLPELAHPQLLENGELRPATRTLTLRHLLTHTAGFAYPFTSAALAHYLAAHNIVPVPGTRAALQLPLLFEPGERWEYGISTDWVGRAVEAASGLRLDAYFKSHITGPLGMHDTVFMLDEDQKTRRATIHHRQEDRTLAPTPPRPQAEPEIFSGGGGLYATLRDYQTFTRIFLNGGGGVASPSIITGLTTNQIGPLSSSKIGSANPAITEPTELFPGMAAKWSFAGVLNPEPLSYGRRANSLGWGGLANTYFWVDATAGIAATILMQVLPSGDLPVMRSFMLFEKELYAALR